jgi:hypothetical protein
MNKNILEKIKRTLILCVCLTIAGWVLYRGELFNSTPYSFMPIAMCTLTSFSVAATGAVMVSRSLEADEDRQ